MLSGISNGVWDSNGTLTSGSLVKQYTLADLEALPALRRLRRLHEQCRQPHAPKVGPEAVTGVKVLDVLADAFPGTGLTAQQSVDVHAPDNYGHPMVVRPDDYPGGFRDVRCDDQADG